jgi:hypothetical protein
MVDMPFGVSQLDSMLDGGVPTGSVVLLATEPGAGGRKFAHTSAAINALATTNTAAFERHYRRIDNESVIVPTSVEYLSVAATAESLETTLAETVSSKIAAQATSGIVHHDLSQAYFAATDVPEAWYHHDDEPTEPLPGAKATENADSEIDTGRDSDDISLPPSNTGENDTEGGEDADRAASPAIFSAVRAALDDAVGENLVVIDAITDLDALPESVVSWAAVVRLLRGLTRLVTARGGLVLVVADAEAVTDTQLGSLSAATTGTLSFGWETGGSQRVRLLSIRELPGALDRLDRDEIATYEGELHDRGYDLSNVRKIR